MSAGPRMRSGGPGRRLHSAPLTLPVARRRSEPQNCAVGVTVNLEQYRNRCCKCVCVLARSRLPPRPNPPSLSLLFQSSPPLLARSLSPSVTHTHTHTLCERERLCVWLSPSFSLAPLNHRVSVSVCGVCMCMRVCVRVTSLSLSPIAHALSLSVYCHPLLLLSHFLPRTPSRPYSLARTYIYAAVYTHTHTYIYIY